MKKRIVCLLASILIIMFGIGMFQVQSANVADIFCDSSEKKVGDTFSVTCSYESEVPMYSFIGTVTYDSNVVSYVSGADSRIGNKVKVIPTMNGEQKYEFALQFKVIKAGDASLSFSATASDGKVEVSGSDTTTVKCAGEPTTEATTKAVTTTEATTAKTTSTTRAASTTKRNTASSTTRKSSSETVKQTTSASTTRRTTTTRKNTPTVTYASDDLVNSSNADLESLTASIGTFDKAFVPYVTDYSLTVDRSVTEVYLTARAAFGATIVGDGKVDFNGVDNKQVVITVTALDGKTKKSYTINIQRNLSEDASDVNSSQSDFVIVDNQAYYVSDKLSDDSEAMLPENYEKVVVNYRGRQLDGIKSHSGITLVRLLDNSMNGKLFRYSEEDSSFSSIKYFVSADNILYIIDDVPETYGNGSVYTITSVDINGHNVKCLFIDSHEDEASTELPVIYCDNGDGDFQLYRYDAENNTVQLADDIETPPLEEDEEFNSFEDDDTETVGTIDKNNGISAKKVAVIAFILLFVGAGAYGVYSLFKWAERKKS